ncbi:MAG: putative metal-binding motif-containing protein [Sandaracinaceae bacterium]
MLVGDPCGPSEACDELGMRCLPAECPEDPALRDADEDGHELVACGGDDCDDTTANRNPGNAEVCDAAGIDEDCDPTTVGGTDADGDGAISAACCNGSTCGGDCDDSRPEIRPTATEQCNAIDDNCDGAVDEDGAFCPAGTCVARRCRAANWETVFDVVGADLTNGLVVDQRGNLYLLADTGGDLDRDGLVEARDQYLISLDPDARVRWFSVVASRAFVRRSNVALSEDGAILLVPLAREVVAFSSADGHETMRSTIVADARWDYVSVDDVARRGDEFIAAVSLAQSDPDGGIFDPPIRRAVMVLRLDSSLSELGRRVVEAESGFVEFNAMGTNASTIALALSTPSVDLGTGSLPAGQVLVTLEPDLSTRWAVPAGGLTGLAVAGDGSVAAVGSFSSTWSPPWTTGSYAVVGAPDTFMAAFDSLGEFRWMNVHQGPGFDSFQGVAFDGRDNLVVSGLFSGEMDVFPRGRLGPAEGECDAFYGLWSVLDGRPIVVFMADRRFRV